MHTNTLESNNQTVDGLDRGPDGQIIYPWEKLNKDTARANKFDFEGHLQAQGRNIWDSLRMAQRQHHAIQQGGGKLKLCTLYRIKQDGMRETVQLTAPWFQEYERGGMVRKEWHELEKISQWVKAGWIEENPFKPEDDPKDTRIKELEKMIDAGAKRDERLAELERQIAALLEMKVKK